MRIPQTPIPKRPFRDTAIFYGALSVIFVVVVWATGGAVLPKWDENQREIGGLTIAILFFFVATAYSWWRFRQRVRLEEERESS
ncbi:MAG TPA: hypothetical protein VGJ40_02450 [Gaiellaceae bacterium]|jgi:membrane protein DedA with SNARE-associated domain